MRTHILLVIFALFILSLVCSGASIARTLYVDCNAGAATHDGTSWDTAFLTIQEGATAAASGDEVWVADGVYAEHVELPASVAMYGGFRGAEAGGYETELAQRDYAVNATIIDGGGIRTCVGMRAQARVDGFTIRNGYGGGIVVGTGTIANNLITGCQATSGAGILCWGGDAVIAHNRIVGNTDTQGMGAGITCLAIRGSTHARIEGNEIEHNTGAGVTGSGPGKCVLIVLDNTIAHNTSTGLVLSEGTVRGNRIVGNGTETVRDSGQGIRVTSGSPWIDRNVIAGNTGGGLASSGSNPLITNNLVVGNTGGGGMAVRSPARLIGNTVVGNQAIDAAGGVHIHVDGSGDVVLTNNVIAGNSSGIGVFRSAVVLSHNCLFGNTGGDYWGIDPGASDIHVDPLLVDPGAGDYHLSPASPCIDAGDDAAVSTYIDFDGDPRVCDGSGDGIATVDIGADEYRTATELTAAPDGLFAPGWVWFSIPLAPSGSADASAVLGYEAMNRVYGWDEIVKTYRLYADDFHYLSVGTSYVGLLAEGALVRPIYGGAQPDLPFARQIPAAGFAWVGVPSTQAIPVADLVVTHDQLTRTASEDSLAANPWLNWNWIYWDGPGRRAAIASLTAGGDDTMLRPWYGYRVWSNTENVTIIFP